MTNGSTTRRVNSNISQPPSSMVGLSLIPAWLLSHDSEAADQKPSWLKQRTVPFVSSLSRRACSHPIHAIVFVALLASTTYIGLLEGSLFGQQDHDGRTLISTDWNALLNGSRALCIGEGSDWKWQSDEDSQCSEPDKVRAYLATSFLEAQNSNRNLIGEISSLAGLHC